MAERGRPRSFDRDQALARAMEVFWAKGYGNASVADLTAAMGIGAPSLYAAFGSKDALFQEAVDHYGQVEGPEVWRSIDEAATAREAVEGYLMASAAAFSRPDKPRGCMVVLSALQEAEAGPAICAAMRRHRANSISGLVARFRAAVEAGEIALEADLTAIATFYVTTQQGMSIQARDGASRQTLEAVAQAAMAAWEPLTRPRARRPA
jgi:AcrR family transcriptional regulator